MHLVHGLPTGGLENGVVNLCNGLIPAGSRRRFAFLEGGGALESRVDTDRAELFLVRRLFGNDPSLPLRLAWHLKRRRIDILHTHSWVTLVEGYVAAKLARVGVVIHGEHGFPMEDRPRNVRVQCWVWNRISQVTAVCGSLAGRMEQAVGFPRIASRSYPMASMPHAFVPRTAANSRQERNLACRPTVFCWER